MCSRSAGPPSRQQGTHVQFTREECRDIINEGSRMGAGRVTSERSPPPQPTSRIRKPVRGMAVLLSFLVNEGLSSICHHHHPPSSGCKLVNAFDRTSRGSSTLFPLIVSATTTVSDNEAFVSGLTTFTDRHTLKECPTPVSPKKQCSHKSIKC